MCPNKQDRIVGDHMHCLPVTICVVFMLWRNILVRFRLTAWQSHRKNSSGQVSSCLIFRLLRKWKTIILPD